MRNQYKVLQEAYEQVVEARGITTPKEIENFIINTYKQGKEQNDLDYTNISKLADLTGVNQHVIYDILHRHNIELSKAVGPGKKVLKGEIVPSGQIMPPDQIKYIYRLIAKRENDNPEGYFEYGNVPIANIVNKYIDEHPELGWSKIIITISKDSKGRSIYGARTISEYIAKYEKEILKHKRIEDGIRSTDGRVFIRKLTKPVTGTRQTSFGDLDRNDGSYRTATGRAQDINDPDV